MLDCGRPETWRRYQPHRMAQPLQEPTPVIGAATGFQHHLGWRYLTDELPKLSAAQVLAQGGSTLLIHPVQCENGFGGFNGYTLKLHGGRLLYAVTSPILAHDAVGAVHPTRTRNPLIMRLFSKSTK